MKRYILLWLPAIILPVSNLIPIVSGHQDYQFLILPIIGAVIEEVIFRWLLLGKWLLNEKRVKPIAAILIVGAVFSLMHLWNLRNGASFFEVGIQMLFAFCFSIWAGAVVWQTDQIWIPLIAHILLNATAGNESIMWMSLLMSVIVAVDGILIFMLGDWNH